MAKKTLGAGEQSEAPVKVKKELTPEEAYKKECNDLRKIIRNGDRAEAMDAHSKLERLKLLHNA